MIWLLSLLCAHRLNISHIDVREAERAMQIVVDVDPHDLPLFSRIDLDGDGELTTAEVEAQRQALDALIAGRIEVKRKGDACTRTSLKSEFHSDVSRWHSELGYTCKDAAELYALYFGFLDTLDRGHQAMTRVSSGKTRSEFVLGPKHALIDVRAVDATALAADLIVLGAEHILFGADHVAFVLALLLGALSVRALVLRLTMFTVAHSITLALALLQIVKVSPAVVEPLIALSIAVAAFFHGRGVWIAFGFGLLHGLGFASAIEQAAFSERAFALSIASFNVGIEFGQLAVVLLAWPVCRRLPEKPRRIIRVVLAVWGVTWALWRIASGS